MDYAEGGFKGIAGKGHPIGDPLAQYQGHIPKPASTMAARLERALQIISGQCQRIENALGRANGAPVGTQVSPEKIAGAAPLAQSVQFAEELGKRLSELAGGLDQIA